MTGEITLSGKILPVGGIKEKLLAAKRAGMEFVLLPKANEKDLKEIDADTKRGLRFFKASNVKDCLPYLFAKEAILVVGKPTRTEKKSAQHRQTGGKLGKTRRHPISKSPTIRDRGTAHLR
jgi:ATP-dependent Lon protease